MLQLKLITENDLEFVRQLRNANRKWFFDSQEISPEQQKKWFKSLYSGDLRFRFYIIWLDDQRAGTVSRKYLKQDVTEIGNLMLIPEAQGKGIMTDVIRKLRVRDNHFYIAFVKPSNKKSLAVFERAGFARIK